MTRASLEASLERAWSEPGASLGEPGQCLGALLPGIRNFVDKLRSFPSKHKFNSTAIRTPRSDLGLKMWAHDADLETMAPNTHAQ